MGTTIQTQGGPAVEGDLANYGVWVSGNLVLDLAHLDDDKLKRLLNYLLPMLSSPRAELRMDQARAQLMVTAPGGQRAILPEDAASELARVASRQADERAYLSALVVNPQYGRWAAQYVPLAGQMSVLEHPLGWTPVKPELLIAEIEGQGSGRLVRWEPLPDITQALAEHEAFVLLGDPGSGKTTTLYRLALDAALERLRTGKGRLPLLVPLSAYRGYPSPDAFVEVRWQQVVGDGRFGQWLRDRQLLILCDGLNEMPHADDRDYRERVAAWGQFIANWSGNQVVFTSRSLDYTQKLGLHQVRIEELDNPRVRQFLLTYLEPIKVGMGEENWARLKNDPLLDLVRNPYYLDMLTTNIARDGEWPRNRAALFRSFVGWLVQREEQRLHPDWPGREALCTALSGLAYRMQAKGAGTRLSMLETLQMLSSCGTVQPEVVLRLGLAATLLDEEKAPDGSDQVRFVHHQLQECFAARELEARFRAREPLDAHWRQDRLAREMRDPGPLSDWEGLPGPPSTGWEEPTVLAAGLAREPAAFVEAVRRANPALAARCLTEAGIEGDRIPDEQVQAVKDDLLRDMGDRRVHLPARIAAGEALGRLGDPRFLEVQVDGHRVLIPPLVQIPGGPFRLGSSRWRVLWLALRRFTLAGDERPRHTVELPAFLIGRFPVTNAEYGCFLQAQGYAQDRYWPTAEARAWRRGEAIGGGPVEALMAEWRAIKADPSRLLRPPFTSRDHDAWEQLLGMAEGEAQAFFGQLYADRPRDRPGFWGQSPYDNPAQPVVGVTWYEALAYCRWLEEQLRGLGSLRVWVDGRVEEWTVRPGALRVRLPSEAEWERAARLGRGWAYPWGNRWRPARANTWEGHVLRPTPVGVYPAGANPEGVHDMSGNVWEWTRSLYQPYPYQAQDGREDLEAGGRRVVRGGSWGYSWMYARCAFRLWDFPGIWRNYLGFRVVFSLAFSGS